MLWKEHFHRLLKDVIGCSSVAEGFFFSCNSHDGASCSINGSSRLIAKIEIWIQQQVSHSLVAELKDTSSNWNS